MTLPDTLAAHAWQARQAAALLAALEAMEGTLALAEALLAQGRRIDLAGLESEMERLCGAALATPAEAAVAVRLKLEALLRALDRLRAGLAPP